jgi:hypothetical protein
VIVEFGMEQLVLLKDKEFVFQDQIGMVIHVSLLLQEHVLQVMQFKVILVLEQLM